MEANQPLAQFTNANFGLEALRTEPKTEVLLLIRDKVDPSAHCDPPAEATGAGVRAPVQRHRRGGLAEPNATITGYSTTAR